MALNDLDLDLLGGRRRHEQTGDEGRRDDGEKCNDPCEAELHEIHPLVVADQIRWPGAPQTRSSIIPRSAYGVNRMGLGRKD
jgi:hypothetical protein